MADCKNCLHYAVCGYALNSKTVYECDYFANKSKVIELPCKVGEFCWFIRNNKIIKTTVEKIVLKEKGRLYLKLSCNSLYETSCRSIGKTVFFTYEEAEQALKERD